MNQLSSRIHTNTRLPEGIHFRMKVLAVVRHDKTRLSDVVEDILYSNTTGTFEDRVKAVTPIRPTGQLAQVTLAVEPQHHRFVKHEAIEKQTTAEGIYNGLIIPYMMSAEVALELVDGLTEMRRQLQALNLPVNSDSL